jgi:hypothetical protein
MIVGHERNDDKKEFDLVPKNMRTWLQWFVLYDQGIRTANTYKHKHEGVHANGEALAYGLWPQSLAVGVLDVHAVPAKEKYVYRPYCALCL